MAFAGGQTGRYEPTVAPDTAHYGMPSSPDKNERWRSAGLDSQTSGVSRMRGTPCAVMVSPTR